MKGDAPHRAAETTRAARGTGFPACDTSGAAFPNAAAVSLTPRGRGAKLEAIKFPIL